jgi:hypothetical protein
MASIKKLKDEINYLTYDLINECFTLKTFHPEKDEQADEIIRKIIGLRNDLISRTNHPEDKGDSKKNKTHYNKIMLDLGGMVKLVDDLSKKA